MNRWLAASALVLAACCWLSTTARADEIDDFERARQAYQAQQYERAVQLFEALVAGDRPRLRSAPLILESRKYLGAAYLFMRRGADAEAQFVRLLSDEPEYQLDPLRFPREVVDLFERVRRRVTAERAQREAQEARLALDRRQQAEQQAEITRGQLEELTRLATLETVVEPRSRWIAAVPFGVGQLQNGHEGLGLALAVAETTLLATSVLSYFIHEDIRGQVRPLPVGAEPPPDQVEARNAADAWRITNWVSTGLLAVLAVVGMIDAQLRFTPERRTTRERPLPEGLDLADRQLPLLF